MDLTHARLHQDTELPHLWWLTLDRTDFRNAWSDEMLRSPRRARRSGGRPACRVLAITGAGTAFSAGGDLKAMRDRRACSRGRDGLRERYHAGIQGIPRHLARFSKPVIAAINGAAIGAGLDLTCMCDIRIAVDRAKFGSTFVRLGLVPGDGGAALLMRVVGYSMATELVLTGRIIDAAEARRIGLVTHVVPSEELHDRVRTVAGEIAANAPVAVRLAKAALVHSHNQPIHLALELAATYQGISRRRGPPRRRQRTSREASSELEGR